MKEFFNERLFKIFDTVNPSVIKAVLGSEEGDILKISQKIYALHPIVNSSDFGELSSTFKRVANIIKDMPQGEPTVSSELFEKSEEYNLYNSYKRVIATPYSSYDEELDGFLSLKTPLDDFFLHVFVNHENEAIRNNRRNLIALVYQGFKNIADIKEVTI